jgi:GT2 family glycosyltransferase
VTRVLKGESVAVTVVVPTYRRPDHLRRCLQGIRAQSRAPDEVVVVRRSGDEATRTLLAHPAPADIVEVPVGQPGVVAALTAGVEAAGGEVVAFLDDDAVPHADWLQRLLDHFRDPRVGGVGGRDVWRNELPRGQPTEDVGRITPWGKLIGNHYLGTGSARNVMVLQGANMAFRRQALALPSSLRGTGAQAHFEIATCLWARKRGWRLIYDPSAVIDHYRGPRFDADQRERPGSNAIRDRSFNLVAAMLSLEPERYWRRAVFGLLIGDREIPGLVRAGVAVPRREWDVARRLAPSLLGQAEALIAIARGERVPMKTFVRGAKMSAEAARTPATE